MSMKLTLLDLEGVGLLKREGNSFSNAVFDVTGVYITRESGLIERWVICWDYDRNCQAYKPAKPYDDKVRRCHK